MASYPFTEIEEKWQRFWETESVFATNRHPKGDLEKFYVLDMFPYPSGVGLHVGHPLGYIATDIVARYKRMLGLEVLHPIGFDAFGLPAEQFAVEHGVHPRITTQKNIENMLRQLKRLGLSYDWSRVVATTDPEYYRWTQWIFLKLYNSYYDGELSKACPIDELIAAFDDGSKAPATGEDWSSLNEVERQDVLAGYRLAFMAEVPVNWCPALGTVLANEEVTNEGRSERGNYPVFKRPLKQWMLRITAYADRLEDDLKLVDWPEPIKIMQRNWIGRSQGAMVDFAIGGLPDVIRVFTTRPDTLFGATYMVLAPEHPLVDLVATPEHRSEVRKYQSDAAGMTEVDRMAEGKRKTGAFTGGYAINPVNGQEIPIWIADYVLMGYGTGAIMAVPGHDQRDFEFAKQFDLDIRPVVIPDAAWLQQRDIEQEAYLANPAALEETFTGAGFGVNSANADVSLNGVETDQAKTLITGWLAEHDLGEQAIQYKLRDWLFSRQRYWGEPFPILHGPDGSIHAVPEDDLPVVLPEMEDFRPQTSDNPDDPPRPPLGRAPESWRHVIVDGVRYERELNTMPQWAGSCWYYLRFIEPWNSEHFVGKELEEFWMAPGGVDLYVGGVEHAVLHLLYARFWHKVLFDLGYVSGPEPFGRLINQGYIQAYAYRDERGVIVDSEKVVDQDNRPAADVQGESGKEYFHESAPVTQEYGKMGKSLKNAVSPDEIAAEFGCDTFRLYEMYLGPLEASKPWSTRDIIGVHRFLNRVWRNLVDEDTDTLLVTDEDPDDELGRLLNRTVRRVTDDLDRLSFNTAIAALIELNSEMVALKRIPRRVADTFILLLAPMAPHMAEELWHRMGNKESLAFASWPSVDEQLLREEQVHVAVQVNGKVRGSVAVAPDADKEVVLAAARADVNVARHLEGKVVRREIYVPGKIVNLVVE
ncbi:MAG: leucine--tRNA ligase [Rhodothermales bacterium]|nr:leucine--tRNA ligase [Rhodothermales bacterium]